MGGLGGASIAPPMLSKTRGTQGLLDIAQVLHQQQQIPFDQGVAGLRHREHVVIAGVRDGLPELPPRLRRRADREPPVAHEERPALHPLDPAFDDAHEVLRVAALDEKARGEEPAAADEIGVGVHEVRKALEHGRHDSR